MDSTLLNRLNRLEESLARARRDNEDLESSYDRLYDFVRSCPALTSVPRNREIRLEEARDTIGKLELENANLRGSLAEARTCLDAFFRGFNTSNGRGSPPGSRPVEDERYGAPVDASGRAQSAQSSGRHGQCESASQHSSHTGRLLPNINLERDLAETLVRSPSRNATDA